MQLLNEINISKELKRTCSIILIECPEISNLKMQKLLYIVQACNLFYFKQPAFNDRIESWQYGPTVPSAYYFFQYYKKELLNVKSESKLDKEHVILMKDILKAFKEKDSFYLVDMTMSYKSWKDAWCDKYDNEITQDAIFNCHNNKYKKTGYVL